MTVPSGLEVSSLRKAFGQRVVINFLALSVPPRSVRCIIGPNASGKSTLLNLIGGQLLPDGGSIKVAGEELAHLPPHRRRWLGISRSFQTPRLMPTLTVREHMLLAARRRRAVLRSLYRPKDPACREFPPSWEVLGLADLGGAVVGTLSHTLRKLLDIAMAIETSPVLLLLDEPTAGLDLDAVAVAQRVIENCASLATVLIAEHNLSFIGALNCLVSFLHGGRIVRTGTLDELRADPLARDVYLHTK